MTTNPPDPFDPAYYMSEQFKEDTIKDLRVRYAEAQKYRERAERRRQRLHRLTFGLLGR
jgi:hypothetical protein